jgi:hypothetical protein
MNQAGRNAAAIATQWEYAGRYHQDIASRYRVYRNGEELICAKCRQASTSADDRSTQDRCKGPQFEIGCR